MALDALVGRLRAELGDEQVLTDRQQLRTYECDGLAHYKVTPAVAVLARTTAHVGSVVRACIDHGVPYVARGSGTGLSGGALPRADGVLVVTSQMRDILEVDAADQRAVVQPGAINLQVTGRRRRTATTTRPTLPASRCVPSVGTWRRTPAGRIA